jgi:hypothetical protein
MKGLTEFEMYEGNLEQKCDCPAYRGDTCRGGGGSCGVQGYVVVKGRGKQYDGLWGETNQKGIGQE